MLSPLALPVAASRAVMGTRTSGPRIRGTGWRPAGPTSRMAGNLTGVVPRTRGSGGVPVYGTSRMAGEPVLRVPRVRGTGHVHRLGTLRMAG